MLFNSLEFPVFLAVVLLIFHQLTSIRQKQYLLLAASLFFYGYWKWTYLLLLVFSSGIDFFAALGIQRSTSVGKKKAFLWLSLMANLGILAYFKYSLFFGAAFFFTPGEVPAWVPIVLPVGISFYTFQAMSYVLDVYRGRMEAEKSWTDYLLFITFFPQLVAGPIERAPHLLGQLKLLPQVTSFYPGILLLLSGFFKKLVLADRMAVYSDAVFNRAAEASPQEILLATVFFGFQIYGDFSGYSDIARGCASFFGLDLMANFRSPYLASNLADFWRRWHISLSGWFRDYLYHPLGGSRNGLTITCLNIFIVFIISGIWHGANWTFLLWGCWHGCGLIIQKLGGKLFNIGTLISRTLSLIWIFAGWFFFRVNSLSDARIFAGQLSSVQAWKQLPANLFHSQSEMALALISISLLLFAESGLLQLNRSKLEKLPLSGKLAFSILALSLLLWFGHFKGGDFIYFQF